jgi:hypothetical protein
VQPDWVLRIGGGVPERFDLDMVLDASCSIPRIWSSVSPFAPKVIYVAGLEGGLPRSEVLKGPLLHRRVGTEIP